MASVAGVATVGVHCCGDADVASLLAAGPDVLSIPARPSIVGAAGYLGRFLEGGGRVAWGVVATDGPMFVSPDRQWRELVELWAELERRGVDGDLLRQRSLVTAHCGLGLHTPAVAERVCRAVREIGRRIAAAACEDQHCEHECRTGERPEAAWSHSPSSSATTTADITSSTTRRSQTPTSTPSCASCATLAAANPDVEFDNPLEGDVGGAPTCCSRRSSTPCR